ncbi:latrophilin Cirl-like isoform X2 [Teleopsis dalmanni]|nr:latrophilin Cirl-like isoform X2 [Teleopsis dalmanni]XP_037949531.1 latrophilin Cirl-like isoform X2 [Teleopsis dalmanni]
MFSKTLTVLNSKCANKQNCTVLATTNMFGEPCPGTHKYLEAHYQCISALQSTTTTSRPSPPWIFTNIPPLIPNGHKVTHPAVPQPLPPRLPLPGSATSAGAPSIWSSIPSSLGPPTVHTTLPGGRLKVGYNATLIKHTNRHDSLPPPPPIHHHHHTTHRTATLAGNAQDTRHNGHTTSDHHKIEENDVTRNIANNNIGITSISPTNTTPTNTRILTGIGGTGSDDSTLLTTRTTQNRVNQQQSTTVEQFSTSSTIAGSASNTNNTIRTINNININIGLTGGDGTNMFCGPTNARNLFWNITRVGDVNVQPCPGGATGIAKWRCVLMKRISDNSLDEDIYATELPLRHMNCSHNNNSSNCNNFEDVGMKVDQRLRNFIPTWHPLTPDLTQCRSLWLNNLEVRVNQRDSSLISIANDLSEVTSSKTLYGGDMLVTTKIIQTMSEKMFHDKETFPDQRQREAIIMELLHGVVKTGSNLLDESQLSSWLDLNQEDQMRVATSLLTGLEYNAFLLADTIIRERNVIQKVKNILLSVRVLETKNIQSDVIFPDAEQWQVSDDRIELPRAALLENSEGGLVRIVFAAFDRLESILKPTFDHFDIKSSRSYIRNTALVTNESDSDPASQQRLRILNSKVISASLGKGRHIQISQPIKLILKHLKTENVSNPTCVFWNYIDHAWSANGCNLESTNRTHSICMCNHLTNFAILMDVMDEQNQSLFALFDGNMRILIYISISICLLFIVIALLTLKIFNGVFIKSARTVIYRSIYICLLFVELLFLLGIEQTETSILCGFTAVFLHVSILAAIAWFCFEAFQSYCILTTDDILLEVVQTSKVNCYYLLSYGLSLTIVAISLAIDPSTYTQNDFCILMDSNALFYSTFVAPVLLFFLSALIYTCLSWLVMYRKSRSALKNKVHSRLSNIRFDIRCSFIFLLLLSSVWISAYNYLRRAKLEAENAIIFGYLFIGFNTLMGLYIFVFHCIQNEKIRREYRKYVRQNSWLPKCLRCSKTSISSGIVGNSTGIGVGTNIGNTTSSNSGGSATSNTQIKSSKLPDERNEIDDTGGAISACEDAIVPSSDCELNENKPQRNIGASGSGGTIKSGILAGNLVFPHGKCNAVFDPVQGHIVLERGGGGGGVPTGSLRYQGGSVHTPSAGHTSPTSSAGSTHLIFGHGHKQQPVGSSVSSNSVPTQESFYHQPDYESWKQPINRGIPQQHRDYIAGENSPQQTHEFFYWTQKHSQQGKKKRGGGGNSDSPSGSLHSRTTAASQILFYPSYKKTHKNPQQYQHYAEPGEPTAYMHHQPQVQQKQQRRYPTVGPQHQHMKQQYNTIQQQQLSSDEEHIEPAAHAHLLHFNRRGAPEPHKLGTPADFNGVHINSYVQGQRFIKGKHSNCDLNKDYDSGRVSETYYNQSSISGDGPVYEEILSNRNSDVQHYDIDGDDDYEGPGTERLHMQNNDDYEDDEDESMCDEDNDEDDNSMHMNDAMSLQHSDERMRRLLVLQDEDFQRRFRRQQQKNSINSDTKVTAGYNDGDQRTPPQKHQQPNLIFGVTGVNTAGGSVRSFKKTSPNKRLGMNELFHHGPPLPPANQHPLQRRQQQQQLSPQSTTSSSSSSHQIQQQQPVGRNISAMLDENNTVRCYLEPLSK